MAVIASFIGAKGLGFNLLLALNQLRIGQALELGICIVLIAVVLDKLSLSWTNKQIDYFADLSFIERHKYALILLGGFLTGWVLAYVGNYIFKDASTIFISFHTTRELRPKISGSQAWIGWWTIGTRASKPPM